MPVKKKPVLTPRKSKRLASKDKRPVVLDDDSTKPPSPKLATPPSHHIPSPPPSPIPDSPPPITTQVSTPPHTSPGLGFADFANQCSIPTASSDPVLSKLNNLQSQLFAFQDEARVFFASITDQLTLMEARLGANLDTVEVQTKFIDEEEHDP